MDKNEFKAVWESRYVSDSPPDDFKAVWESRMASEVPDDPIASATVATRDRPMLMALPEDQALRDRMYTDRINTIDTPSIRSLSSEQNADDRRYTESIMYGRTVPASVRGESITAPSYIPNTSPGPGLEEPILDPVSAIVGGGVSGALSGVGRTLGQRAATGALRAGLAGAAEFPVGQALDTGQEYLLPNLPEYAKLPVSVATGLAAGALSGKYLEGPLESGLSKLLTKFKTGRARIPSGGEVPSQTFELTPEQSAYLRSLPEKEQKNALKLMESDAGGGVAVPPVQPAETPPASLLDRVKSQRQLILDKLGPVQPEMARERKSALLRGEVSRRFGFSDEQAPSPAGLPGTPVDSAGPTLYSNPIEPAINLAKKAYGFFADPMWDAATLKGLPKPLGNVAEKTGAAQAFEPVRNFLRKIGEPGYHNIQNNDEFVKLTKEKRIAQALGADYGIDLGKRLQKHNLNDQYLLGQYVRGEIDDLPEGLQKLGDETKAAMYQFGDQMRELGLIDDITFFKNAGQYMPRLYTDKETYDNFFMQLYGRKPNKMDMTRTMRRKDLDKAQREALGEILQPGYPVAKGIAQMSNDIAFAQYAKKISEVPEWAMPSKPEYRYTDKNGKKVFEWIPPKGAQVKVKENGTKFIENNGQEWRQLDDKRYGKLNKAFVHPEIYDEMTYTLTRTDNAWQKITKPVVSEWGFWKIMNPGTMAANGVSNSFLLHIGGLPMVKQPYYAVKAIQSFVKKDEMWQAAKATGLLNSTYTKNDLRGMLDQVLSEMGRKKYDDMDDVGFMAGLWQKVVDSYKGAKNVHAKAYQAVEETGKMMKFIHNMNNGMNAQDAADDATKWLFDYADITKWQKTYKDNFAPFATFDFKSIPRVAEAYVKTPWRFVFPAMMSKLIIEHREDGETQAQYDAKKKLRPDYMQGELPVMFGVGPFKKLGLQSFARTSGPDEKGAEGYTNLARYTPTAGLGELFPGGGYMPGSGLMVSNPVITELGMQMSNYDPFFKQKITSDKSYFADDNADAYGSRLRHLYNTFAPASFLQAEKIYDAAMGQPDYRMRERPLSDTLLELGGWKTYRVNYQEAFQRRNKDLSSAINSYRSDIKRLERKKAETGSQNARDVYQSEIDDAMRNIDNLIQKQVDLSKTYQTSTGGK